MLSPPLTKSKSQPHTAYLIALFFFISPPNHLTSTFSSPSAPHPQAEDSGKKEGEERMAAMTTSAVISIPSFTGLKAGGVASAHPPSAKAPACPVQVAPIKASLREVGVAVAAAAASAALASNALAIEVLLGSDDGGLAFVPSNFTVARGEKIVFRNNAAFPHNVVFDEDAVPAGVDVSKISMSEEDLLNAPGEVYSVTLTEAGTYEFYCSPHQGAGMAGKVTVN